MRTIALVLLLSSRCFAGGGVSSQTGPHALGQAVLYVLDSDQTPISPHTHVYVISISAGTVMHVYEVGSSSDITVAPDGTRLYVQSNIGDVNYFDTYDTSSGALIKRVQNPDATQFTIEIHPTQMAISPSGKWLYLVKNRSTPGQPNYVYLTAYDTVQMTFLPSEVPLYGCEMPTLLPSSQDLAVDLICPDSTYLRHITLGTVPGATQRRQLAIPEAMARPPWGAIFLKPGGRDIGLIALSGNAISVNTSGKVIEQGMTGRPSSRTLRLQRAVVASSRNEVYFGIATQEHEYHQQFDEIVAADVNTAAPRATLGINPPAFTLSLGKDENLLFAVSPTNSEITVIDAVSLQIKRKLFGAWKVPVLAIPVQ